MKVLIVSASHPEKTAGTVAKEYLIAFREIGVEKVKILTKSWDYFKERDIVSIEGRFEAFLNKFVKKIKKNIKILLFDSKFVDPEYSTHEFDETITYYKTERIIKKIDYNPDIIIILFIAGFISFKNLYELQQKTKARLLLRPLDYAPFTGGCHWMWACTGYKKLCGSCPALNSKSENDLSRKNILYKKSYVDKLEIEIIVGNSSMENKVKQSFLFRNLKCHKFPFVIKDKRFRPFDPQKAREKLGLPINKKLIFFGAVSVGKRKGMNEFIKSLEILATKFSNPEIESINLVQAGNSAHNIMNFVEFKVLDLGFISYESLPLVFNAVDIFVSPSIEDAGPMMINQSLLCGTPVVSFETGVALDVVITGKSGYRAKNYDVKDFAEGIYNILCLDRNRLMQLRQNCISIIRDYQNSDDYLLRLKRLIMS